MVWAGQSQREAPANKSRWSCSSRGLQVSGGRAGVVARPCSVLLYPVSSGFFSAFILVQLPCSPVTFFSSVLFFQQFSLLQKCFCVVYPVTSHFICTEDKSCSKHWLLQVGCSLSPACLDCELVRRGAWMCVTEHIEAGGSLGNFVCIWLIP